MSCYWYGGLLVMIVVDILDADTKFGTVKSMIIDAAYECSGSVV